MLVGKDGVTGGLVEATSVALEHHELIKVRLGDAAGDRHEVAAEIATRAAAMLVQVIGRIAVLYRARADEPAIKLPA